MVSASSFDQGRSPSVSLQLSQILAVHTLDSPLSGWEREEEREGERERERRTEGNREGRKGREEGKSGEGRRKKGGERRERGGRGGVRK